MNSELNSPSPTSPDDFRCPTCGARQVLADTCRRCKCDLSLVVAVHQRRLTLRRQCLQRLARQQSRAAVQAAEELHALAPDADSTRLLAVACLASGEFAHAARLLGR